ncbi:ArgE/DapE family deacylase [soil metagenome]
MIEFDKQRLTETLAELVSIPSINPDLNPGAEGERQIAEFIAGRLRETPGIDVELQDAGNGRPNVIATVGSGSGRTLMLNGHIDTVGVAGMAAQFDPVVEDGRLYGRGSSDMKGADAVMMLLLEEIARAGDFPGRIVATFVVDEEYASIGTQAVCRDIGRWKPDAALVLEGTRLDVSIAHKGFVWATITTRGHAAHGSRYQKGIDAIAHMGRVIVELEALSKELVQRPKHRYVGPPSLHASLIRGGQELSSYPEECVLEIERRTVPGESDDQVHAEFQEILDRLAGEDPQFTATLEMGLVREPFEIAEDAEIVQIVRDQAAELLGHTPELTGGMGWMDSALLSGAGVPTAIFGPAGEGAHALEEWSDLDVLHQFATVLAATSYAFCSDSR